MSLKHLVRQIVADNINSDRLDWNSHFVLDQNEQITDELIDEMLEEIPEKAESFGRTGSRVDPNAEPKAIYAIEKSQEEQKNLGRGDLDGNLEEQIKARIWNQIDDISDRGNRVQSNSVKYVEHLMTASPQLFREDPNQAGEFDRETLRTWLEGALEDVRQNLDVSNIASIHLHLDESTPHLQIVEVPETEDGRLCVNDVYDRERLRERQDEYAEATNLERGDPDSDAESKEREEIYQEQVERLISEKEELQERVDKFEFEKIKEKANSIRELPFDVQEKILDDPDEDENAIDNVVNETDLNFAEAVLWLEDNEKVQRHIVEQEILDNVSLRDCDETYTPVRDSFLKKVKNERGIFSNFISQIKEMVGMQKSFRKRLADELDLDSEQRRFLENYEEKNGEEALKMMVRDSIETKRKDSEVESESSQETDFSPGM